MKDSDSVRRRNIHSTATPEAALAASEPWILRNGVGIQIMETLALGPFLTALAVELGASNLTKRLQPIK